MAGRKRKPGKRAQSDPSDQPEQKGDLGPDTPAAMDGATIHEIARDGRSPVRRKFRDHLLEKMARPRKYDGKHVDPLITDRQKRAGLEIHDAWCETELRPEQTGVYVDVVPDFDAITLRAVERIVAFSDISKHIPKASWGVVYQVCIAQVPVYHGVTTAQGEERLAYLRSGLDVVADAVFR